MALLAFLAQIGQNETLRGSWLPGIKFSLLALIVGTTLAGMATGLSFVAQYGYFIRSRDHWLGRHAVVFTFFNVLLVTASYAAFLLAGFIAFCAIR